MRVESSIRSPGAWRYVGLARVYASLSARAAIPLGTPIFFGIFVVACIVFGPQGMDAADLVFMLRTSPLWMILLWFGWIVLLFPVARLALVPPSSLYLRWLPAPRAILYVSAAFCTFVVELPWIVLFGRGEGIVSGFSAGFGAVALHAAWATRPFGFVHALVLLGWAISAFLLFPCSNVWGAPSTLPWLTLTIAGFTAALAVAHAIDRAPEMHALARGATRVRAPEMALALAHVTYIVRKEPAVVGRMIVLSALFGLILPFAARGHDLEAPSSFGGLAFGISAVALSPAMSGVSAAVIRSERLLAWLSDVLGTSARTRVWAAALASSLFGIGAGVFLGLVAVIGLHSREWTIVLRLVMIPILWGVIGGAVLTGFAREAEDSPRRGDRGMTATLIVMIAGIVSASLWGEYALGLLVLIAVVSFALAPGRWELLRRRRGTS